MVTYKIITCILLLFFELFCVFNIALGRGNAVTRNERQWGNLNDNVNVNDTEVRNKRSAPRKRLIEENDCTEEIKRLCGNLPSNSDDLFVLECVQSFKVSIKGETYMMVQKLCAQTVGGC
jgi:hypothetical protein